MQTYSCNYFSEINSYNGNIIDYDYHLFNNNKKYCDKQFEAYLIWYQYIVNYAEDRVTFFY